MVGQHRLRAASRTAALNRAFYEALEAKPLAYAYEPDLIRFKHRCNGRIYWRGPHRFYHPDDIHPDAARWNDPDPQPNGPPVQMLGVMCKRFEAEIWPWLLQNVDNEGMGKRSRWCRARAFQFIFRRDEDAFAFKMRFG